MLLSLSGFLFEDDYRTQSISVEDFVETAVEGGYHGVELRATQVGPEVARSVIEKWCLATSDAGLSVTCIVPRFMPPLGRARNKWLADYLSIAADLRCPLLKLSGEPEWMRLAAVMAEARGIHLAVNTHIRSRTETVAMTLEYLRAVGRDNYGVLYDPMHLMVADEDYVAAIDCLYPYLCGVLVQCARPIGRDIERGEAHGPGFERIRIHEHGGQDWIAIMRALRRNGYGGWATVIQNGWPGHLRKRIAFETAKSIRELWDASNESKDAIGRDDRRGQYPVVTLGRAAIATAVASKKPVWPPAGTRIPGL
jgi:sugar phosphate isomerase/epimerase